MLACWHPEDAVRVRFVVAAKARRGRNRNRRVDLVDMCVCLVSSWLKRTYRRARVSRVPHCCRFQGSFLRTVSGLQRGQAPEMSTGSLPRNAGTVSHRSTPSVVVRQAARARVCVFCSSSYFRGVFLFLCAFVELSYTASGPSCSTNFCSHLFFLVVARLSSWFMVARLWNVCGWVFMTHVGDDVTGCRRGRG